MNIFEKVLDDYIGREHDDDSERLTTCFQTGITSLLIVIAFIAARKEDEERGGLISFFP